MSMQLPADTFPRRIPLPSWYTATFDADLSRDGRFVAFSGSNAPNADSMRVSVLSLADGAVTPWFTSFDALRQVGWLKDGTLLVLFGETSETYSICHLLGPGRAEKLGTIPRRVSSISVSKDLKRVTIVVRDHHGDAWMSKVVRRAGNRGQGLESALLSADAVHRPDEHSFDDRGRRHRMSPYVVTNLTRPQPRAAASSSYRHAS